jgi:uncharacterized membrane protein YphA (DoxX/SURF4 family)
MEFKKSILLKIISSLVGSIFLFSALTKLIDIRYFTQIVSAYNIDIFVYLIPFLIILEVFLGIELLLNLNIKRNSLISLILLIGFTLLYLYGSFAKEIEDCGCFGNILKLNFINTIIKNIFMIASSVLLYIYYKTENTDKIRRTLALIVIGFGIFFAGNYFKLPANLGKTKNNDSNLQNTDISKTDFGKVYQFNKDSTYLVFAFSYTCLHCLNSIENAKTYKNINSIDNTIFYFVGDEENKAEFYKYFSFKNNTLIFENAFTSETVKSLPTTFLIKNNKVNQIFVGELPASLIFEKKFLN